MHNSIQKNELHVYVQCFPIMRHTFGFENNFQCSNENTLRSVHIQRFTVEVTVTQQLNQGKKEKCCIFSFLTLVLFVSRQKST